MKHIVIIITCFISISILSQELNTLKLRLDLLESKTVFKLDSSGISNITLPSFYCITKKQKSVWHLQDLNKDGLEDLIFSGSCMPYNNTAVFLNNKKGFDLVYDYPGELLSITEEMNSVTLHIIKQSIGCDYKSDLIELAIKNTSTIRKNTISFHSETDINISDHLRSITVSGILRSSPMVNDTIKNDPCRDTKITGNQLKKIVSKKVVLLYKKEHWSLVLVKMKDHYSIIGWIANK